MITFDSYYKNCQGGSLVEDVHPILFHRGKSPLQRHFEDEYPEDTLRSEDQDLEIILGENYQPISMEDNLAYITKKIVEIADEMTIFVFQNPLLIHDLIIHFYVIFSMYYKALTEEDILACLRSHFEDEHEMGQADQQPETSFISDENLSKAD